MRDFKSGDIHGDVTINDSSRVTEYKLLVHCNNDELLGEEEHRRKILRKERSRKGKIFFRFICLAVSLLLIAAVWFYFKGELDDVTVFIGGAGVAVGIATLQRSDNKSQFERRQIDALNEINHILRERGVR